ncbi:MAG: hypothetical protein Q4G07_03645 [Oscillospiraceae bacterium]|nr:hypothetical protein [Oscillospiraceae bacterium]
MLFQILNLILNLAFLALLAVFMVYAIRAMAVYIEKNTAGATGKGPGQNEDGHKP